MNTESFDPQAAVTGCAWIFLFGMMALLILAGLLIGLVLAA